jgi:ribosome-associated protein
METISLGPRLALPLSELDFSFTRSGGPGGQHVNRNETKVELRWDITNSATLNEHQRRLIEERLPQYITKDGILRLVSNETRSQHRNRQAVMQRLQNLVTEALRPRRKRRPTRPSAGVRARRIEQKRRRSEKKKRRRKPDSKAY